MNKNCPFLSILQHGWACFSNVSCNFPLTPRVLPAVTLHEACFLATFFRTMPQLFLNYKLQVGLNTTGISFSLLFFKTKQFHWLSSILGLHHYIRISFCLDQRHRRYQLLIRFAKGCIRSALKCINAISFYPSERNGCHRAEFGPYDTHGLCSAFSAAFAV